MHLQHPRRLIDDLDGVNVFQRGPQATEATDTGFAGLTAPVTITFITTLPGTVTPPTPSAPPVPSPPVSPILGIPTIGSTSSTSSTVLPGSSAESSVQPTSSPTLSAGSTTISHSSTKFSSTASPSQSSDGESAGSGRTSSKLSSGGIAAIVFAMVIVAFCVVFLIMRKRSRGLRERKKGSWSQNKTTSPLMTTTSPVTAVGPLGPLVRNGTGYSRTTRSAEYGPTYAPSFDEDRPTASGLLTVRNGAPTPSISTVAPQTHILVPPTSYNNGNADSATFISTSSITSQVYGGIATAPAPGTGIGTVICTYITNLPDELPIRIGEIIRVVAEYDDGWGLCTNSNGEQGMVPLECLQMGSTPKRATASEYDTRRSRRASSLVPQ